MPLGSNKAALFAASLQDGGARGLFAGGDDGASDDVIDYINIASLGNATDFGNLSGGTYGNAGCSSGSNDRGVSSGNHGPGSADPDADQDVIEYVTISSAGNVTDFGNLPMRGMVMGLQVILLIIGVYLYLVTILLLTNVQMILTI